LEEGWVMDGRSGMKGLVLGKQSSGAGAMNLR